MEQAPELSETPTPDPNVTTAYCIPQPAKKRPTTHIDTPDLNNQAKKFKMEDKTQEGVISATIDETELISHLQLNNIGSGNRLGSQIPEVIPSSRQCTHGSLPGIANISRVECRIIISDISAGITGSRHQVRGGAG